MRTNGIRELIAGLAIGFLIWLAAEGWGAERVSTTLQENHGIRELIAG